MNKWEKAADGHYYHPAIVIGEEQKNDLELLRKYSGGHYKKTIIGCRNCIGCDLDYARDWANRGYLESTMYPKDEVWFVTLTYDDDHRTIPEYIETSNNYVFDKQDFWEGNLIPHDLALFWKNLRRRQPEAKIRYMSCGEYGTEGNRPHYHAIVYGLKLTPEDLYKPRIIDGNIYYQSKTIESAWIQEDEDRRPISRGISNVSQATWNNIGYVARYITKKINGKGSEEMYASNGQIKPFFRVSNRPGIGQLYYEKYKEKIYANDEVIIKNKKGVHHCKPPQYFDELFEKEYPERMKAIKEQREKMSNSAQILKDLETSLLRRERLKVEERAKETQASTLRRIMK